MKAAIEQIREQLEAMDESAIISAHNNAFPDDTVYDNYLDEISELFPDSGDAIRRVLYGEYDIVDDYFTINGYGNLESFNTIYDKSSPIDLDELTDWLADNESLWSDYGITVATYTEYTPYEFIENYMDDVDDKSIFIEAICQQYEITVLGTGDYIDIQDGTQYTPSELVNDLLLELELEPYQWLEIIEAAYNLEALDATVDDATDTIYIED